MMTSQACRGLAPVYFSKASLLVVLLATTMLRVRVPKTCGQIVYCTLLVQGKKSQSYHCVVK